MNDPIRSLWGALIGDACGAFLEGLCGKLAPEQVRRAMQLPGGGRLATGAGQITDDGELSLALWGVLQKTHPFDGFPTQAVAKAYGDWYESMPFDMGQTCAQAFEIFNENLTNDTTQQDFDKLLHDIHELNKGSEANGAMMRATPIAVWYTSHRLNWDVAWTAHHASVAAAQDARLSHSSHVTQDANAAYVYALALLLQKCSPKDTIQLLKGFMTTKCDTVQQWFSDSEKEWMSWGTAQRQAGHVKHAFTMAMWFLRHPEITYEEAIRMVLEQGGDTDTNAAIVGGIVACYQPIPSHLKKIAYDFDSLKAGINGNKGHQRPATYCIKYQLTLL